MKTRTYSTRIAGFSLLEVLVAVVILSFGLLALAALQGALFKSSAEAKAQSVALGLATEKLEYFRGYRTLNDYRAIDTGSDASPVSIGGVDFSRSWVVSRYAFPSAGGSFTSIANTIATPTGYEPNNEFKRIVMNVTWTDAENSAQRVSLEESLAAIDPADSAKLSRVTGGNGPRGPEVRYYNPEKQQPGVIPIAVGSGGDDTDTAATNPKPLVNGNNVLETRYDVLTYNNKDNNLGTAELQARVETSIVGCSCNTGNAPASGAMRPTFWDGTRYTVPETSASLISGYTPPAGPNTAATQSSLCTICCRDHRDPSSLPAGAAKFDPRNSNHSAGHYLLNASTAVLTGPVISGIYTEACRVIRVDGVYRVAADAYNDYQNFLGTRNDSSTTAYLPTAGRAGEGGKNATADYQSFVTQYLVDRVVNPGSQSNWNDILPITAPGTVAALESSTGIYATQPNAITFSPTDPPKWLHLRGLYIDYLENKALQAIQDAKDNCQPAVLGGTLTQAELDSCVFKVLPFTSINLTELGNYSPLSGTQIVVANNNFYTTLSSTEPVRGKVVRGSNPTTGQITNAVAMMRRSNSGLTTLIGGIDTQDATTTAPQTWTATQPFKIQGTYSSGGIFYVNLTGYPFTDNPNAPYILDSYGATCNYQPSATNNFVCTTSTIGVARTLTFGKYNYTKPLTSGGLTLTCTNAATSTAFSHTFAANGQGVQSINVCKNFSLDTGGTVSPSDGVQAETTALVTSAGIVDGSVVNYTVVGQSDTQSYTCVLPVGGTASKDNDYVVSPKTCP